MKEIHMALFVISCAAATIMVTLSAMIGATGT